MVDPPRMSEVVALIVDEAGLSEEEETLAGRMALAALHVTNAFKEVNRFIDQSKPSPEAIIAKLNEIG